MFYNLNTPNNRSIIIIMRLSLLDNPHLLFVFKLEPIYTPLHKNLNTTIILLFEKVVKKAI